MVDIYLISSDNDRSFMVGLFARLTRLGYHVWSLQYGTLVSEFAKKKIEEAKLIICLTGNSTIDDKRCTEQIKFIKNLDKQIYYLALESVDADKLQYFKISKVYKNICELPLPTLDRSFVAQSRSKDLIRKTKKEFFKSLNQPWLMVLILISSGILMSIFGLDIYNIHLNQSYSYLIWTMLAIYLVSFIPYRITYVLLALLNGGWIFLGLYYQQPYYISGVSIVPLLLVVIFSFVWTIRYAKKIVVLNWLLGIFYTLLISGLYISAILAGEKYLNTDFTWTIFIITAVFLIGILLNHLEYCKIYRQWRGVKR